MCYPYGLNSANFKTMKKKLLGSGFIKLLYLGFIGLILYFIGSQAFSWDSQKDELQGHTIDIPQQKDKRMNVLFLMADQFRGDYMGVAGADFVITPHIDKLATEGVSFNNGYVSVPSCLPARASILTGMSPWGHGQLGYTEIPEYPYELPKIFNKAGYFTKAIGKNHFHPMRNTHGYQSVELEEGWYTETKPNEEQSDYVNWFRSELPEKDINATGLGYVDHRGEKTFPFEEKYHPTHWTAQRAIEFLKTQDTNQPWLLKVSFQRPHPPFDPPERWMKAYKNVNIPLPKVGKWSTKKYGNMIGSLTETPNATSGNFPMEEIIAAKRTYCAAISFVDEQIGRVLETLRARGELENTIILFTSDHGDMMGDQHMWRKCRPYEGSSRIPMIVRWPENGSMDFARGQLRDELVELRDVLPTFLDATGINKPNVMDGMSMLNILREDAWRRYLDLEHAQIYEKDNAWTALTDGRYKYIYYTLTGQQQLFDLKNDPSELYDLASTKIRNHNGELLNKWRKRMIDHLKVRGDEWVRNGDLVVQDQSIYYGKNHPNPGYPR